MESIYRKSSLEKLSSPEQLDKMLHITSPMSWVALTGLLLIVVMAFYWGMYGEVTERIEGEGIYWQAYNSLEGGEQLSQKESILCYVPLSAGKKIQEGMPANVIPSTVNQQETGYIKGYVKAVGNYSISKEVMLQKLGDDLLVEALRQQGEGLEPILEVEIELMPDEKTVSGYAWSNKKGTEVALTDFTLLSVYVVTESKSPFEIVFGKIF